MKRSIIFTSLFFAFLVMGCGDLGQSDDFPPKDQTVKQAYVGYWKLIDAQGSPFYLYLRDDGRGYSTWNQGTKGEWHLEAERVITRWQSGWVDWIYHENGHFKKLAFAPGTPLSYQATSVTIATKITKDQIPKEDLELLNILQESD
jgi:hypothetical protein